MRRGIITALPILLLLSSIAISKETLEESPKNLPPYEDNLEKEMMEIQLDAIEQVKKEHEQTSEELLQQFEKLHQTTQFACTGGKNPSLMDSKSYLGTFAAGPCSPAVMAPGIMGSKLVAKIDCNLLQYNDPATFKACGWTGCGFLNKKPKDEYRIWIPTLTSPASIVKPYGSSKKCFAELFGLKVSSTGSNVKVIPKTVFSVDTLG